MYAAHIPQMVDGVPPQRYIVRTVRMPHTPPEPISAVLVERAKEYGNPMRLHPHKKIRDHIEIRRIDGMEVAARHAAVQDATREIIRRVAGKVIAPVYLRPLCHAGEVRHVHGEGQQRPLMGRLHGNLLQFIRMRHARRTLRLRQCQLLARQGERIKAHKPRKRPRHILRVGVRPTLHAEEFMVRVVLVPIDSIFHTPERHEVGVELTRLCVCRAVHEMHRPRRMGSERRKGRRIAFCLCRIGQHRPHAIDSIICIIDGIRRRAPV